MHGKGGSAVRENGTAAGATRGMRLTSCSGKRGGDVESDLVHRELNTIVTSPVIGLDLRRGIVKYSWTV